jgi:enolase
LNKIHPLLYIEDPLFEDDWEGWAGLRKTLESTTLISGGTHVATSIFRLQMALDKKTISALTVLPLQVGTVIETIALIEVARKAGCKVIMGRAQEETTDTFTADLAVGCGADYIKCGGPQRGEHVAIYNRLSFIDQQIRLIS